MHAKLSRSMRKSCGSHKQDSIKMDVGELHRRAAELGCEWRSSTNSQVFKVSQKVIYRHANKLYACMPCFSGEEDSRYPISPARLPLQSNNSETFYKWNQVIRFSLPVCLCITKPSDWEKYCCDSRAAG